MSVTKKTTIAEKLAELEQLLAWFESDAVTVEVALKNYEKALRLAEEIEAEIKTAKNQVEVIQKKFSA